MIEIEKVCKNCISYKAREDIKGAGFCLRFESGVNPRRRRRLCIEKGYWTPKEVPMKPKDLSPELMENYLWIKFKDAVLKPASELRNVNCGACLECKPEINKICNSLSFGIKDLCKQYRVFEEWKAKQ